jgi:hypothetical protein
VDALVRSGLAQAQPTEPLSEIDKIGWSRRNVAHATIAGMNLKRHFLRFTISSRHLHFHLLS